METLYIVIGAFSSIFIFLLGYSVSGVFNGKKRMDEIESYIRNTDLSIEELNRKLDTNTEMLVGNITELDKDVYSHIDSRLDKLETKLKGMIPCQRRVVRKNRENRRRILQTSNEYVRY